MGLLASGSVMDEGLLLVVPTFQRGGAERVASLLSQEWSRRLPVTVAVFDGRDPAYAFAGEIVDLRAPAAAGAPAKAAALARRVAGLARLIARLRPRRIVSFMESANFAAIPAAAQEGRLGALTASVRIHPDFMSPPVRLGMRWLYRLPARVVGVSRGVRDALARDLGLPAARCLAIPNPLDLEAIAEGAARPPRQAPPEQPFVLAAGRLDRQKGFDLLLEAFARAVAAARDGRARLVILGEGPERAALLARAAALGIAERLLLPGAVADPWAWMARAAAFALSSRLEGWPNALAEAMACGAPVAAFACRTGPREMIADGRNGLLVADGDVAALGDALARLLGERALARRLGEGARAWARGYALARIAPLWLDGAPPTDRAPSTTAPRGGR